MIFLPKKKIAHIILFVNIVNILQKLYIRIIIKKFQGNNKKIPRNSENALSKIHTHHHPSSSSSTQIFSNLSTIQTALLFFSFLFFFSAVYTPPNTHLFNGCNSLSHPLFSEQQVHVLCCRRSNLPADRRFSLSVGCCSRH